MPIENPKLKCPECGWVGRLLDLLTAPNPFEEGAMMTACPYCKAIDQATRACDEDGCTELGTCGTPTPTGYRVTCYQHRPKDQDHAKAS